MLHLTLPPAIVIPALWVTDPASVTLASVVRDLEAGEGAIGAEAIRDAGGWGSLILAAQWVDVGEQAAGADMNVRAVIVRLMEMARARGDGSDAATARLLGVNATTVNRWRRGATHPMRRRLKLVKEA